MPLLCFECGAPASHQHHVVPKSVGGTRTVPLCERCHGLVHGRNMHVRMLTIAGLEAARSRGVRIGRRFKMTATKLRLAMAAMGQPETRVNVLCLELGITRQTLYRHVSPDGTLRADGRKLLQEQG